MDAEPAAGPKTFGSNHRLLLVGPLPFSHLQVTKGPKQHLHEIKNDLVAEHYHFNGSPSGMQSRNAKLAWEPRAA